MASSRKRKNKTCLMMETVKIDTIEEYNYLKSRGFEPLLFNSHIKMDITLRKKIQAQLFGHAEEGRGKDVMAANERFFRWIYEHLCKGYCEECMRPIRFYSAVNCSHILSRGAYPEMAIDVRNINILCFDCHNRWEHGNRESMRIYPRNLKIIEELKNDYKNECYGRRK